VWVLRRLCGFPSSDAGATMRMLLAVDKVAMNRPTV
jgi:hypothetical protein